MSQGVVIKCSYFNSGYCRYTKKEMGCKKHHPSDDCTVQGCREKACPNRHPKKCKFEDKCMFQSRCSYKHFKEVSKNKEKEKLQEEVRVLKAEITKIKKDNDIKIIILAKVHLSELEELKQENSKLNKSVNDLRKSLASEESKEGQALLKSSNKLDTESECNVVTKLKLIKYKCDHCSFEAKSARGLKTHIGHMHKDQEKVKHNPEIQIYICVFCEHFYNNKEEFTKHANTHGYSRNPILVNQLQSSPYQK